MVYHQTIATSFGLQKKNTIKNLLKNGNGNLKQNGYISSNFQFATTQLQQLLVYQRKKNHNKTIKNNLKLVNTNSKINIEINCFLNT
jgi:hypothetical protein